MAYLGKTPSQAVRSRYYFTASGGETSLSGTDDNGNTLTFTDGNYVDVSLNGVALVAGSDYNTTTANTIGGLTALTASDVVEVVVYDTFSVFSGAFTGDISLGDNVKAKFGASDDLQIYHDGSNSYISEQGTGNLFIQADAGIVIESASTGENYIAASANGAVTLFYDNASKLATTSSGIDVTGTVTADGILNNNKSEFFASEAALVSTGSSAKVYATNTTFDGVNGSLVLQSRPTSGADVYIATGSTPKTVAKFNDGGDIAFYDSTGVTQGLFWDASAQRLGLGTTSPNYPLTVHSTGDGIKFEVSDTVDANYRVQVSGNDIITGPSTASDLAFQTHNTTRMTITSGGNVGIGQSSPATPLHINGVPGTSTLRLDAGGTLGGSRRNWAISAEKYAAGALSIEYGSTEGAAPSNAAMTIDSSGRAGIGTTSPASYSSGGSNLVVANSNSGANAVGMSLVNPNGAVGTSVSLDFVPNSNIALASISSPRTAANGATDLAFNTYTGSSMTEKMRITSGGVVLINKTSTDFNTAGIRMDSELNVTRANATPVFINRTGNDGGLIQFYQAGVEEGSISVSGTTVSYNGGHLARWSQLADNTKDTSIVKGTVMTNLDQMAEWTKDGVTEDNEQLNCMAVSSVEGDANVAGVFVNWDDDDEDYTADMNIAMTGDMVIRIAQGTTVARGDLLMSAGDGTAKPQGDDIVRSKTIAKVTSTTVSHTYDDGSYLVPCVLMAC